MNQRVVHGALIASSLFALSQIASAATGCVNPGGTSGCQSTINAAVAAAAWGDTILVAPGVYKEDVVITKAISLLGRGFKTTVIDAKGLSNGIFINGFGSAPKAGVTDVTISGFTIKNANFEGILVASGSGITITHNHVTKNNLSLASGMCPGIPDFETNEQMDCGEGVHLLGADHSVIASNLIDYNSGGILVTDETIPTYANLITENTVKWNGEACGITLASHAAYPGAPMSFGVYQNTVLKNESDYNGLNNGGGAGVGMYAAGPGNVNYGNVAIGNVLIGNGLPGVAMHNHASFPLPLPPVIFRDNSVIGNYFRSNGADTGDAATAGPTGINVFSMLALSGIVITNNVMEDEAIGISFNTSSTAAIAPPQMQAHLNLFEPKSIGIQILNAATVDGTLNWWGCPEGPGKASCATTTPGVLSEPWLTSKPDTDDGHFDQ
jgi:hypothetical protein